MPKVEKKLKAGKRDTLKIILCVVGQDYEKQWSEAVVFGDRTNIFATMTMYFRHKNTCPICEQQVCK